MATEAVAPTRKERLGDWKEASPLRRWRKREQLSMMDAAAVIGASLSAMQLWEQGATMPNDDSLELIARAMGIKASTLRRSWREWYDDRPT